TGPGDDDGPNGRIAGDHLRLLADLGDELAREHVELRFLVDGDDAHRVAVFDSQFGHELEYTIGMLALALLIAASLPQWFPLAGNATVNADQLTEETYGTETFHVGDKDVEVKGHHWTTNLYPLSDAASWTWDGEAVWSRMQAALVKQGFKVASLQHEKGS